MSSAVDASATLQKQFEALQEQQARKLARRKQRAEERTKSTSSLTGRQGKDVPSSSRSELSTAASHAFGIDDDLGLKLAPPPVQISSEEEQQNLRDQIRELRDESGRLYKLLSERDLEVRQLRKKNDQQKAILETSGSGTNETAALKIVELSKKVRELTADVESERTKSKQWARKCMELEEKKDVLGSSGGGGRGNSSARAFLADGTGDKPNNLENELKTLQHRFNQSEQKASEMRNECQRLRQELKMAQKVLANEVGEGVTVQSLINASSGWRGRAQQILALQKKVTELKSQQQHSAASTTDSIYGDELEREFLGSGTSRRMTPNDAHREQLRKAERERKETQERLVKELHALEADQETVKGKLEASKARNKVLAGEVKSLKAQISTLLGKGKHDDELIEALMKQQTQLKSLIENTNHEDASGKAEVEARLRDAERKSQQDANVINQMKAIVAERDAKVTGLEEELSQLKLSNLQQAQVNGVNALFERAASRAASSASNRPGTATVQDDGTVLSSPTPPSSASSNATRQSVVMADGSVVAPPSGSAVGVPLVGPIPKPSRVPSAQSERPGSRKQSARDHPTNSSGDPGVPQISAAELQELQAQVQQFKSLSQAAEVERDKLAELLKVLNKRINEVTQQATDAQQEVQAQKRRSVMLEKQLGRVKVEQQGGRSSGKRSSKLRGSTTTLHELVEDEGESAAAMEELQIRLEIQQDENAALKAALQSTLRAKEEDLHLYQEVMEQTKAVFLQGLRQHRQQ